WFVSGMLLRRSTPRVNTASSPGGSTTLPGMEIASASSLWETVVKGLDTGKLLAKPARCTKLLGLEPRGTLVLWWIWVLILSSALEYLSLLLTTMGNHSITADSGNSVGEISGHSKVINAVAMRQQRPFRAATVSD